MDHLINTLKKTTLNCGETEEVRKSMNNILDKKKIIIHINWLNEKVKNTNFDFLKIFDRVNYQQSLSKKYDTVVNFILYNKDEWETYIWFYITNEQIMDVVYQTDRYWVYQYSEHGEGNGDWQGHNLDEMEYNYNKRLRLILLEIL